MIPNSKGGVDCALCVIGTCLLENPWCDWLTTLAIGCADCWTGFGCVDCIAEIAQTLGCGLLTCPDCSEVCETQPSCPSLYYWNGEEYVNRGFILGGAIPKENEYVDQVRLKGDKLAPEDGSYWLQIRETEPERSFIDTLRIRVVDAKDVNDVTTKDSVTTSDTCPAAAAHGFDVRSKAAKELLPVIAVLKPTSAEHSRFGDVLPLLKRADEKYTRSRTGDIITLSFPYDPNLGEGVDFIFDVKGYYEAWPQ